MIKTITRKCLLQRLPSALKIQTLKTATSEKLPQTFRTLESNPINHNLEHEGQFYTIPIKDKNQLFLYGGLPKSYEVQTKTFNETCLMVRRPGLSIINCLKSIDFNKPAIRFAIYGKKGTGKSLALAHIIHYCFKENFLIVHVPWVGNWMRRCKEVSNSEKREGFVEINLDAAAWLLHFKSQNETLLSRPEFVIKKDYEWSKREITKTGAPLLELIDHGINRVKYASETIIALAEEIKMLSKNGVCKTLVAIDGYNAFFYPNTRVINEKKQKMHPHKVTLTEGFLNLTKYDWNNAVIVVCLDEIAIAEEDQINHMPRYLLGKDGFEHLDPFVPISVENFNEKEFKSCMDYYKERLWVTPVDGQDEEIAFLTARNPYKLMQVCASL